MANLQRDRAVITVIEKHRFAFVWGLMLLVLLTPLQASADRHAHKDAELLDRLIEESLSSATQGHWHRANQAAEALTERFPDFALGHLMLAESKAVLAGTELNSQQTRHYTNRYTDLLLEARARSIGAQEAIQSRKELNTHGMESVLPDSLIQVGAHIDHVIVADLAASMLYLYDTSTHIPVLLKSHYISSGRGGFNKKREGDLKSPLGVYRITGFRADETLPPLYGAGALMLNYPNALDRSLGRTGSGIWLHGIPRSNRSRSPRSSEGCVTMSNDHLIDLYQRIDEQRTTVVLSNRVTWQRWAELEAQRARYQELFAQFKSAWLNNDVQSLSSLYSPSSLPVQVQLNNAGSAQRVANTNHTDNTARIAPVGVSYEELAAVNENDISIFLNPRATEEEQTFLIMSVAFPESDKEITLFWQQSPSGHWQIRRESIVTGDV